MILALALGACAQPLPQGDRTPTSGAPGAGNTPSQAVAAPKPGVYDIRIPPKEPPPLIAPGTLARGDWHATFLTEEFRGQVYHITGLPAELEDGRLLFRADDITYDRETGDVKAFGHVYYRNFALNRQIWASRVEYNTEEDKGRFWDVIGETHPRIVTRPGVLSVDAPFHFQGEWAEVIGDKYILYHGWATNCRLPKPWWRLRARKFDIIPDDRAIARNSIFMLRRFPLFYAPVFYHSLQREPRKSGFLIPNLVPHSQRGFMVGLGYYWAISRSYDATYRIQDFTTHAFTHHLDFRGNPRAGTDFNAIVYGVQDRGIVGGTNPPTYSGASIYAVGRSDLGNGWTVRGYFNYLSSFRFRQEWSESFTESINSEIHSLGFVDKNWSTYTLDFVASRVQNFESIEVPTAAPNGGTDYLSNAVIIRKLPEAGFSGRDRQVTEKLPLWFSFDTSGGLLYRDEPIFSGPQCNPPQEGQCSLLDRFQTGQFTPRLNFAPRVTSAFHLWAFDLVPSFAFHETYYGEAQSLNPANGLYRVIGTDLVRSARDFSLDFVLPSLARVFDKKTIFGDKLKHVVESRATYRYVTGVGTDYNRFIRFDETDLLSDTNELTLSLTNRIYARRGDSVQEIFTWELAQKRYFDPTFGGALLTGQRNVFESTADLTGYAFMVGPRSSSPVVSMLRISPVNGIGIRWMADYDHRYHGIVDSAFAVDYRYKKYFFLVENNAVHKTPALQTPPADQFHFRFGFGDSNRKGWNAFSDVAYDYRAQDMQYISATVTYNTDCCGISVQYRGYNIGVAARTPEIRIAFSLANVGTFGNLRKQDRLF